MPVLDGTGALEADLSNPQTRDELEWRPVLATEPARGLRYCTLQKGVSVVCRHKVAVAEIGASSKIPADEGALVVEPVRRTACSNRNEPLAALEIYLTLRLVTEFCLQVKDCRAAFTTDGRVLDRAGKPVRCRLAGCGRREEQQGQGKPVCVGQ